MRKDKEQMIDSNNRDAKRIRAGAGYKWRDAKRIKADEI